jgi:hypothetical protein
MGFNLGQGRFMRRESHSYGLAAMSMMAHFLPMLASYQTPVDKVRRIAQVLLKTTGTRREDSFMSNFGDQR